MSIWIWVKIIGKILELIAEGMSKVDAVACAASIFNVNVDDVWKHGGF